VQYAFFFNDLCLLQQYYMQGVFSQPSRITIATTVERDAANIPGWPLGVFRHDLHGIHAVGLEDAQCPCRPHTAAGQEHDDLADNFLPGPGIGNALRLRRKLIWLKR
jgi:hypothetical protein